MPSVYRIRGVGEVTGGTRAPGGFPLPERTRNRMARTHHL
jgi:hypothetical protein